MERDVGVRVNDLFSVRRGVDDIVRMWYGHVRRCLAKREYTRVNVMGECNHLSVPRIETGTHEPH